VKMKIISSEPVGQDGSVYIYLETPEDYRSVRVDAQGVRVLDVFPKENYSNGYEHFAAIMSKFNPYTGFLAEPIPLNALGLEPVMEALSSRGLLSTGTGFA